MSKTLLQINTTVSFGSVGHDVEDTGIVALKRGWRSVIAYGRTMGKKNVASASELIRIGNDFDNYAHWFLDKFLDCEGLGSYCATRKLIQEIKNLKPDIIHLHNLHDHYLNIPKLFEFLAAIDTPIVFTHHDCWHFVGDCSYPTVHDCQACFNGDECRNCAEKRGFLLRRPHKNFITKRKWFCSVKNMVSVGVSKWLSGELAKSFFNKYPVVTIYNGIDTDKFCPSTLEAQQNMRKKYGLEGKFIIMGAGTGPIFFKGKDYFEFLAKNVDGDIVVATVGLRLMPNEKPPNGVLMIPRTQTQQELVDLYSCADIIVSLSGAETFGKTVVEALSCGTPVIVWDRTAPPELVSQETGIVVPYGNVGKLLDAVNEIKRLGKSRYSSACRSRAVENFDMNITYNQYIDLYEKLLKN